MDKVVDKNRLQESSRWQEFFQSVAAGLQVSITLLLNEGSCLMHTPEVCPNCGYTYSILNQEDMARVSSMCSGGLVGEKFITHDGDVAILQKIRNKLYIVIRECPCMSGLRYPNIEQRANSAQKLLDSFLSSLNEEIEGGERAVELLTLRQINHIIIAMFHGKGKTIELALDLIISALIILLDVKGCWIEYKKDGKTHLLSKGDKAAVEDYLYKNAGNAVVEKIANGAVHGELGVLLPADMNKVPSLLPAMAQECLIAFEIEHLFQLMQSQMTRILGSIESAVLLFDQNNEVCYANGAAGRLLGCDPLELIGKNAEVIDCPWTFAVMEKAESRVSGMMDTMGSPTGDRLVDWQVCPIHDEYDAAGKLVIADDRSHYYKWLEVGKKAERLAATTAMIGPLAHHLRNPIAAAKGLAQLMGQKKDPQKVAGYNSLILRELDRVTCLLNEFLMLGKPAAISSEPLDLKLFFEELAPILTGEISGTGIEITTDFEAESLVLADSAQLTQVVLNLVRNSVEAIDGSGIINISLKDKGDSVEIIFTDNGPGIPDEIMPRLFEPFFTTKERGTGLGLPVAQAIVNNHGGQIVALNSKEGGAVFTIILPAVSNSLDMKHRLDVILVSKDEIARNSLEQVLNKDGIRVISAKDLASAFSMNQYYYPKILIMDESFANTSSIGYARKIWPNVRVLAIGKNKPQFDLKIQHISFPVEYSILVDKVRSMLLLQQNIL